MTPKVKNPRPLFLKRRVFLLVSLLIAILLFVSVFKVIRTKTKINALFKLNKVLQEENYYMAEFEYKMLGIAYYLDKGRYSKSYSMIDRLYAQLKTKDGLIKVPEFASKEAELEFYLNLQNPKTGAFMDDAYPLCTFHGPTENVLLHMEALAKETGQPLRLKYPLKYLDEINTPEKLRAYLEDISIVGKIASMLPQTTFHCARDILSLAQDKKAHDMDQLDMVIQNNDLYHFSPEWRHALLKWFYENQDPETGLWGPKSKKGKLLKKDLNNSVSIMKAFVDESGNDIHASFPLRYRKELVESALKALSTPEPGDDALAELHEWNLKAPKSIRLLTRYLWKDASKENKEKARALIENFIRVQCGNYYVPEDGAFSYYPGGDKATLDGTGGLFIFKEIGAFSSEKQNKLWGNPEDNITDSVSYKISELSPNDIFIHAKGDDINSLRFYRTTPDYNNLASDVFAIVYPRQTSVLDIIDFTQKMKHWIETTPQTMGNWVSKEDIRKRLDTIQFDETPIYEETVPLEMANKVLMENHSLVVIGFDVLQIPRYRFEYVYSSE